MEHVTLFVPQLMKKSLMIFIANIIKHKETFVLSVYMWYLDMYTLFFCILCSKPSNQQFYPFFSNV